MSVTAFELSPAMPDDALERLAVADAKKATSAEEQLFLRSPEMVSRWVLALTRLVRDAMDKQAAKRAEMLATTATMHNRAELAIERAQYEEWRRRAGHFKHMIEDRLSEAKELRRQVQEERQAANAVAKEERQDLLAKIRHLRFQILRHQEATAEPSAADVALWSVLHEGPA